VNPRERWQSLQSHLSAARGALAGGDKTLALEHIEAALLIDPEFLAARMLRDRVTSPEPEAAARAPLAAPQRVQAVTPLVGVPSDALASLEERVMQRVRERTQTAARSAVSKRQPWRVGVQLATAAVFLTAVSSTAVYEPRILTSRSFATSARLVDVEAPAPIGFRDVPEQPSPSQTEPPLVRPASNAVALAAMIDAPPEPVREPPTPAPQPQLVATIQPAPPAPQPVAPAPRPVQVLPSTPAVVSALLVSTVDDRSLVDQTLQRYRRAYNRLDAQSARAVYPAVNANALARAFESLEFQSLSFDTCEMDVRGHAATVTCHGTSRYVPKVGNRITHVEPRIWNFTLRKDDGDWTIENARAAGGR
jgi:hypothetical protein